MKISAITLRNALESKSWREIKELISQETDKSEALSIVTAALRTASKLINKYPKPNAEKKRRELFSELNAHFSDCHIEKLIEAQETLILAEEGYQQMAAQLANSPSSSLDGASKVQGVITIASREAEKFKQLFRNAFKENKKIGQRLITASGQDTDINTVIEKSTFAVAMTIQMEAQKNNWVDGNGVYVLPERSPLNEEDINCCIDVINTAITWSCWQNTEQRARFYGGNLKKEIDPAEPNSIIITHEPNNEKEIDLILANERLNLSIIQDQLKLQAWLLNDYGPEALKPRSRVLRDNLSVYTIDEAIALESLSDLLSINALEDETEYFGLKLKTIVRCYAALTHYVGSNSLTSNFKKTLSGWQYFFSSYDVNAEQAQRFISAATFSKSSSDLFDTPFIQLDNGQILLFSIALHIPVISRLVLSNFLSKQIDLHDKGKTFEDSAISNFKESGIHCFPYKKKINNEEYEFDIVVPWDEYLFIIECKNNILPFGSPSRALYFEENCKKNINQLNRLCEAIKNHPTLLADKVKDIGNKTIVPVLLNCLPYSRQGAHNGVYFYDAQSLRRFFLSGIIGMSDGITEGVLTGYPQFQIWSGTQPSSADFMRQLISPFSHHYLTNLFENNNYFYAFGNNWLVNDNDLIFNGFDTIFSIKD